MLMDSYIKIVSLKCFHTYFEFGRCKNLEITPGENTLALRKKFGFILQMSDYGFDLFANTKKTPSEYIRHLSELQELTYFDFNISSTDTFFYNVTNLPLDREVGLSFSSNSELNIERTDYTELMGSFTSPGHLPNLMSLQLFFDDLIRMGSHGREILLHMRLEARSIQWNYFIINNAQTKLLDLVVVSDRGTNLILERPTEVVIGNGQNALLFTTEDVLIHLSETPKANFRLIKHPGDLLDMRFESIFKTIVKLPNPSVEDIIVKEVGGRQIMTSNMYIYI